jgi:hypothetical protein
MMALHCVPVDHLQLQNSVRSADALRQPCADGAFDCAVLFHLASFCRSKRLSAQDAACGQTGRLSRHRRIGWLERSAVNHCPRCHQPGGIEHPRVFLISEDLLFDPILEAGRSIDITSTAPHACRTDSPSGWASSRARSAAREANVSSF